MSNDKEEIQIYEVNFDFKLRSFILLKRSSIRHFKGVSGCHRATKTLLHLYDTELIPQEKYRKMGKNFRCNRSIIEV